MHKSKTFKPLISFLAIFALLMSGQAAGMTPATAAASFTGCQNSRPGSTASDSCNALVSVSVSPGVFRQTVASSLGSPTTMSTASVLFDGVTLGATTCTKAFSIARAVGSTVLASDWAVAVGGSTGAITITRISGSTPPADGTYDFVVTGVVTCDTVFTKTVPFKIIMGSVSSAPSLDPNSVSIYGTRGEAITDSAALTPYDFTLCSPTSGVPASYSVTTLPTGLTFETSSGVIRGTPTALTPTSATITATCSTQVATTAVNLIISEPGSITTTSVEPQAEPDRKVTICHRTHSETNPYVRITVDYNSVNKKSGHQGHDEIYAGEHVFKAGIYARAKDKLWGDIIPADPSGLNRWKPLNMTTLGAQIYAGTVAGCPSFNPVTYYNNLRESGVPEKQIKAELAELETEQAEAEPSTKKTNTTELKYTGSSAKALEEENDKVTICHATNATTNPYRKITVSSSSITNKAGHSSHDDIYLTHHVYDASVNYPANKKDWGDIIPADPTGKNRWKALNWTTLGQQIYNGTVAGCAEQTTQEVFNLLREAGLTKKEVKADLEKQKNVDDDPQDIDEIKYDGKDPEVEKTEPKEPVVPPGQTIVDQTLSGIVWLDLNRDGLKDSDEPFMKNIPVTVTQITSVASTPAAFRFRTAATFKKAAVTTVNTDENGFYIFPSLGAGDWKATASIPTGLEVTYDSQGSHEGEVIATVPVSGAAFTWVGLVSETEAGNIKLLEKILTENPSALPIAELPAALQVKVKQIIAAQEAAKNPVVKAGDLAYTGTNQMAWLFFGLLLLAAGLVSLGATRLARQKK